MSVTIKPNKMKYKNSSGNYVGINAIAEQTTAEEIADIQAASTAAQGEITALTTAKKTEIDNKAAEVTSQLANAAEVRNMLAGTFSTSTNYTKGQYVIQTVTVSGSSVNKLYRFTADHPAGNWLGTDVVEVKLADDVNSLSSAIDGKADLIHDTVSNVSIASIPDGADGMPVDEIVFSIEPVQDLHGYENPWPAGGGANIFNPTIQGDSSLTRNNVIMSLDEATGKYKLVGLADSDGGFPYLRTKPITLQPGTYYKYAFGNTNTLSLIIAKNSNNTAIYSNPFTLESETEVFFGFNVTSGVNYNDTVGIVLSTTAQTTWTPYSNICPITGWTGANPCRTGKNLLDDSELLRGYYNNDGVYNSSDSYVSYIMKLKAGSYTFSTDLENCYITRWWSDDVENAVNTATQSVSFTLSKEASFRISMRNVSSTDISSITPHSQIEIGSSASSYSAFSGQTISVTFPNPPGTVFGGTLKLMRDGTGVLTVTDVSVDMGGINYSRNTTGTYPVFITTLSDSPAITLAGDITIMCSRYAPVGAMSLSSFQGSNYDKKICKRSNNTTVLIQDSDYTDPQTFKTALSGSQLVYKLATPVEYTLSALEVIELLKGQNNIFCDTGNVVSMEYPCDTKGYIDKKVTELQALILEN